MMILTCLGACLRREVKPDERPRVSRGARPAGAVPGLAGRAAKRRDLRSRRFGATGVAPNRRVEVLERARVLGVQSARLSISR